ncbi:unnamed protein product, partial [Allacma fusca]
RLKTTHDTRNSFLGTYKCKDNDSKASVVVDLKDNRTQNTSSISPE